MAGPTHADQFCIECFTYGAVGSGLVLIVGPSGADKSSLTRGFMRLALQNDREVIFVRTESSADEVLSIVRDCGQAASRLRMIDPFGQIGKGRQGFLSQRVDLARVSGELNNNVSSLPNPYLVFESLDDFVIDAGEDEAFKFFVACSRAAKARSIAGCGTLTSRIHSSVLESRLRTFFQAVIELRLEETNGRPRRLLRIHTIKGAPHPTDWYPFIITGKGIMIGDEQYRLRLPPRHSGLHFLSFEQGASSEVVEGERRLAAIMFTDIVGYTALTQSNEPKALDVLELHNRLLRPIFPKHRGKEIKTVGDSFLVEFESALHATLCAIEIQDSIREHNTSLKNEWKIRLRIGIHLGDVVHKEGDVFGDAVNIASRIEPIAEPEGICISQQVYDQIRNKIVYPFEQLEQTSQLKNVKYPISVYKIILPWESGLMSQTS